MGFWAPSMESCSSGEEVVVKARKPYTITKQRERWTEEEHNRFLEALRLYGRAWQRIEEHIGTKTAIQIRSHAQKFFTKIEKEALAKGISPGETLDIDIPPPRPKRKPSNPYPRKTGVVIGSSPKEGKQEQAVATSHSSCPSGEAVDHEKGLDETPTRTETQKNAAGSHGNGACTEVLPLFSDAPSPSISSKECLGNPLVFREFVPMPQKRKKAKNVTNKDGVAAKKENKEWKEYTRDSDVNICRLEGLHIDSQVRTAPLERLDKYRQSEKVENSSVGIENVQTHQEHTPMHLLEEIKEERGQVAHSDPQSSPAANQQSAQTSTNTFRYPSISTASEHNEGSPFSFIHQLPSFEPFCMPHGHDAYRSFCNASSNFSNLIVSALMQNPAAHAAATLAASFWSPQDSDKNKNPVMQTLNGMIPGHMNPHPNMSAIASATIAAATAWWAMHGLFPLCHAPFPPGFPFVSAATSPIMSTKQDVLERKERRDDGAQIDPQQDKHVLNSESPEQVMLRRSASKSAQSSDSYDSRGLERLNETKLKSSGNNNELVSTPDPTFYNAKNVIRGRKQKDDLSQDSNEHCTSEAGDIIQEKPKDKKELEESPVSHDSIVEDSFSRCGSNANFANESRKEVSEEGRIAFQALFSREELPQSFSPRSAENGAAKESNERGLPTLSVDLNAHFCTTEPSHASGPDDVSLRNNDRLDTSVSTCETGNPKPRARRMGFKPYKRCSMEANVGRTNAEEEKGNKRLHLEGKASTL